MFAEETHRHEDGLQLGMLVWRPGRAMLAASTAVYGGGLGPRRWVLNAQVPILYRRTDPERHVTELARGIGLTGAGVGILTAAEVARSERCSEDSVDVQVTVGLSHPTWAADGAGESVGGGGTTAAGVPAPGTINIIGVVPVRLEDGALLNALVTVTEAKCQALWEAGIPGTGTASDAVCILCPLEGAPERFGGPRSPWGARLARATHGAVLAGARQGVP